MDSKLLYPIAILIAAISSGYYYYSGKGQKLDAEASRSMTYTAKQIQVTQTDDRGQLHLRAQIDALEQDMQKKSSSLQNLNAQMYKAGQIDSTFQSAEAHGFDNNAKVVLSKQVTATKIIPNGNMQFKTEQLTVHPKQRFIETDQAVTIESPQARFDSRGVKADLNTGQYEFFNIRGKYEP